MEEAGTVIEGLGFNAADWVIAGVIGLSTLISLTRGFVKEALSLAIWLVAFVVARLFAVQLAQLLEHQIAVPSLRLAASFALLFVGTLIVGAVFNFVVGQIVKMTGLSGTDRLLGMAFGMGRGMLLVVVAVAIVRLSPVEEDEWYKTSRLIPTFVTAEAWLRDVFDDYAPQLLETVDDVIPLEQVIPDIDKDVPEADQIL